MICIATPFVGRHYCLDAYLASLEAMDWPKDDIVLLWLNRSPDESFAAKLNSWIDEYVSEYAEIRYVHSPQREPSDSGVPNSESIEKRILVAETMERLYANRPQGMDTLIWEDDHEAPDYGLKRLHNTLQWNEEITAVSGVSWLRKSKACAVFRWEVKRTFPTEPELSTVRHSLKPKPYGVETVGAVGTYFILIRGEFLDSYSPSAEKYLLGQDMNLCWEVTQILGKSIMVDWSVRCPHWDLFEGEVEVLDEGVEDPYLSVILFAKELVDLKGVVSAIKLQKYDSYEIVIETGGTISECVNRAVSRSRGTVLVFTESDCRPLDEWWLDRIAKNAQCGSMLFGEEVRRAENFANLAVFRSDVQGCELNEEMLWASDTEWFIRLERDRQLTKQHDSRNPVLHMKSDTSQLKRAEEYGRERAILQKRYGDRDWGTYYALLRDAAASGSRSYQETMRV